MNRLDVSPVQPIDYLPDVTHSCIAASQPDLRHLCAQRTNPAVLPLQHPSLSSFPMVFEPPAHTRWPTQLNTPTTPLANQRTISPPPSLAISLERPLEHHLVPTWTIRVVIHRHTCPLIHTPTPCQTPSTTFLLEPSVPHNPLPSLSKTIQHLYLLYLLSRTLQSRDHQLFHHNLQLERIGRTYRSLRRRVDIGRVRLGRRNPSRRKRTRCLLEKRSRRCLSQRRQS